MINKLSVILIIFNDNNIHNTLNSINNQTFTNWEVFIITLKKSFTITEAKNNKYHIIEIDNKSSIFNILIPLSASLPGNFITFINDCDINDPKRFEKQISFMNSNNSINICSCLETPLYNDMYKKQVLTESNNFINSDHINSVISASYVPLDLYTFVFRKSFLIKICCYSNYYFFNSELDLILYFLRFEKISKLPEILYYVNEPRLPYDECVNYCESANTTNKLAIFNKNKVLDNQCFFNEIINSKKELLTCHIKYKYTIIAILNTINIGGTESYVINLANKLKKENIQLCILTNQCFSRELFIFYNIPLYILNLNNIDELKNTLLTINNIKLIQIHMEKDISLSPIIKSILNVPIILTIHGIYYSDKEINTFLSYIDEIIFVSEYAKKYYNNLIKKLSFSKYITIPNGIENSIDKCTKKNILRESLGISENSIIVLYCSRLSFNKSKLAILFLKSFYKIACKNKNIFAVIIGNGDYMLSIDRLCRKINKNLINKKIFVLGNKFKILDYYSDSDLIIGTGRVAIEAMSLGKAVISFGLNGDVNIINQNNIKKMINSNFGDHSFNPKKINDELIINDLSTFMNILIHSNEKRKKLGFWNQSYIKKYLTLDKIAQFYINKCEI